MYGALQTGSVSPCQNVLCAVQLSSNSEPTGSMLLFIRIVSGDAVVSSVSHFFPHIPVLLFSLLFTHCPLHLHPCDVL
uniref:Uncharacterized protein n=1 Tax=Anguilla anguilla TaxID=7936 RepID=A0A0E9WL59_ANGAN